MLNLIIVEPFGGKTDMQLCPPLLLFMYSLESEIHKSKQNNHLIHTNLNYEVEIILSIRE